MRMDVAGQALTIKLSGDIDHHNAKGMREQIDEAAERCRPAQLRLDFGEVSFMDSSGVGLIMGRYRLMQTIGGTLVVQHVPERLEKMMKLAGLDRLPVWEKQKQKGVSKV